MKATKAQQQALLSLMNRVYQEIRAIEEAHHIIAREGDYRPRIEYFHDAVRAYTEGSANGFERTGRLSVESLAADIVMLRQIKDNPRIAYPQLPIPLSPGTAVEKASQFPVSSGKPRVDIGVISALSEGYAQYTLLFAALLAAPAERNFMNRNGEAQEQLDMVKDLLEYAQSLAANGEIKEEVLLAGITDPELRQRILQGILANKANKHASNAEILTTLKGEREAARERLSALDNAHLRFASSQLVVFQEAQKLVKRLAQEGMNIVGDFVEQAVREAERSGGRGF